MKRSGCRRVFRSPSTGTPIFLISPPTRSISDREGEMSQKKLSDLNACSKDDFVTVLTNIFEYSPWIAEHAASVRPFAGVKQLFEAMKAALDRAPPELRLALIKAHPDLANKTQRAAGLTAESSAEQNSAGLDRLSDAEYVAFERVNNAYRTMQRPKCRRRSRKSAGSRRCASISWCRRKTDSRCTAGCRRMCSIPIAAS